MHQRKLDALRGIASLVVLAGHTWQVFGWRLVGAESLSAEVGIVAARHAVLVFFLLSGYLITESILANTKRNGVFAPKEYLVARIARIYPPLVGCILLAVLVSWALAGLRLSSPGDLYQARAHYTYAPAEIWNALLMRPGALQTLNGPLWSLFIEARLYVVAMLVAVAAASRARWIWGGLAAVWLALDYASLPLYGLCAAAWGIGASARVWRQHPRARLYAVAMLTVLGILASPGTALQMVACPIYAYLIFVRPEGANPPNWMVASADFSYSLYVTHFPLLMLSFGLLAPLLTTWQMTLLAAVATMIACVKFAWVFSLVAEDQPRYRRWIRAVLPGPRPATSPIA